MDETRLREWLKSGEYLPPFLRDSHDAKDFFKWIDVRVQNKIRKDHKERTDRDSEPWSELDGYNWVMLHILIVDFFLWYCACHGYTLQKTRKRIDTHDWEETHKRFRAELLESFAATVKQDRAGGDGEGVGQ